MRYVDALEKYINASTRTGLKPALALGREAVVLGVRTLELVRIHEEALSGLEFTKNGRERFKRAEDFFAQAIIPVVESLSDRTLELSATHRQLQRGVARGKSAEAALKKSGEHFAKLLKESLELQEGLRQLTHQALAAQEDERRKISVKLQDEIAQTLLGINVRLLSLKQEAGSTAEGIHNDIASAQRLVVRSAASVRRIARNLDKPRIP